MASIFLAVGHGMQTNGVWDPGCTWNGDSEAKLMFDIAGVAVGILRDHGIKVHTDWDTNNDRNMTYTIRDANALGVDAYISLHCDFSGAPSGTLPIYYPGSDKGYHLAKTINDAYCKTTGLGTRGISARYDLGEVSNTHMPACIFETGSIKADNALLHDYKRCGTGIAKGILDYFGVAYKGEGITPEPKPAPPVIDDWDVHYDWLHVQYFLHICNYRPFLEFDGIPGPVTRSGVENAQRAYGLEIDKVWGPDTDRHAREQVKQYQVRLKDLGFYLGEIDGIAGPLTFDAVKAFQSQKGLGGDGCVGPQTFGALF